MIKCISLLFLAVLSAQAVTIAPTGDLSDELGSDTQRWAAVCGHWHV